MNISVLPSQQIEKKKWDTFIEQSREANIYATYDYLQHCERQWKAAILEDETGYQAVMPFQVSRKWGIEYIYQDPFARELGIFTKKELTKVQYQALLDASLGSYRYVARYHFNVNNSLLLSENTFQKGGESKPTVTFHLDLRQSYEKIWKKYRQDRRYSIKRAQRYDQQIIEEKQVHDALTLFRETTYHRIPGLAPYQLPMMEKLYRSLLASGKLEAYYASYEGEKIAAALVVRYKKKLIYLFGTNNETAFRLRTSSLLLDHIIRKYAEQDLIFDFEGGEVPSLGSFYASFGAAKKVIPGYSKVHLPVFVRWLLKLRKKVIQKKRG
ncbi:MAG: GNAT family N-acetyltransferase [Cyclobacteriaceae bacterium]